MFFNTLSGRFLGLTILFVMIVEVLIFLPSVARFRQDYLQNQLDLAQLAALASLGTPSEAISPELEMELLHTAGVNSIVLRRDGVRELVLASEMPGSVADRFDISQTRPLELVRDALLVFLRTEERSIHVSGVTRMGVDGGIEIDTNEGPLRSAMIDYGTRVLLLSFTISLATAALLFFSVRRLIVKPIKRVISHMVTYRDNPEDTTRIIEPVNSTRELNEAEAALRDLEVRLTSALKQKDRLAALGGAVAKISHDLRNMLATAQILVDGIEASPDPGVRKTAPKLVNSLSRAVNLCERTLTFGKAEEPSPDLEIVPLSPIVAEVVENERQTTRSEHVEFRYDVPDNIRILVDPDQLYRVLSNLMRNAAQAIDSSGQSGSISVSATESDRTTILRVSDTGPGLPQRARDNLFKPFEGGVRQGGTGLGLVIAEEIIRGHGGQLLLELSDEAGTTFAITLPAPDMARATG